MQINLFTLLKYTADLRGTTRIAQEAFAGCTNLRLVQFKILKMLGRYAFSGCVRLKEIEFPESLEQMGAQKMKIFKKSACILQKLAVI